MNIFGIHSAMVAVVWPTILPWLLKARAHTWCDADATDWLKAVLNRDMQLWVVNGGKTGAFLTRIVCYDKIKTLEIVAFSGQDLTTWVDDVILLLKAYAKEYGCGKIEATGRIGWMRFLRRYGAKPEKITLTMEV